MSEQDKPYEGWAVLEIMGHRRLGGYVRQVEQYGAVQIRIDIPGPDEGAATIATQFYGGQAIYCLSPCGEVEARALARNHQPAPVTRWEMPALEAPKGRQRRINCNECGDTIAVPYGVRSGICKTCVASELGVPEDVTGIRDLPF